MRLLCDEMLARLARWLRAAGHDVALAFDAADDRELLTRSRNECRPLITRDTTLAQLASTDGAVLLTDDDLDAQALVLARKLKLDWLADPFSRCLVDNTLLRPALAEEIARAPKSARHLAGPFHVCPQCARLYWPGSHVRRMVQRLAGWKAANESKAVSGEHRSDQQACRSGPPDRH